MRWGLVGARRALTRLAQVRYAFGQDAVGGLRFRCNCCGWRAWALIADLERERPSCPYCGSTVRYRSIVALLSMGLFGRSLALPDFPVRPDLVGLGLSDWKGYAAPLAAKLAYTNTYLHTAPRLDITQPAPELAGTLDFLIISEVFEHVAPPVSRAFTHAHQLLKPGGLLCFTVPYCGATELATTHEHFPDLFEYRLVTRPDGTRLLENVTRDGVRQVFDRLTFHGGAGMTLEMRIFAEADLLAALHTAGFQQVTIHGEPDFDHGIYWSVPGSLPITARA